jgi:radical SAM superfamily enzyme YgiQ (UPF0313 family)
MSIQFSRGCPFNCEFCNVTVLFGHGSRMKKAEQVVEELDALYALGWRGPVFFVDDNFIGNKRYLKSGLLPVLIRWRKGKRGMPFNTEASINLADDPLLMAMMVEAGFDAVFIGIETPDESGLTECNKNQNKNRDLAEDVRKIQRAGLQVQGGFIVGFDSDTRSIFQRQMEFIQKSGIVTAMVGLLQAPPGTRLYDRLKKEGRLSGLMSGNTDGTTNIVTCMDFNVLRQGYDDILRYLYSPKQYYQRMKTFFQQYHPPRIRVSMDIAAIPRLFSLRGSPGCFRRGALSVLANAFLDIIPSSPPAWPWRSLLPSTAITSEKSPGFIPPKKAMGWDNSVQPRPLA